jgi:uncharacterized protein (TIRG00374 family)
MKTKLVYLLRLSFAIIILACFVGFSDFLAIKQTLRSANLNFVVLGTIIFLGGQCLSAQRWRCILAARDLHISLITALRLNLIGTFSGNFLPGQAAGDLIKAAFLFNQFPDRKSFLLVSVVYDRLQGVFAILSISCCVSLLSLVCRGSASALKFSVIGFTLILVFILFFSQLNRISKLFARLGGHFGRQIAGFSDTLLGLFKLRALLLRSFFLSVIFQLSWAFSLWLMLLSIMPNAPIVPVLIAAPISVLIAVLPVSIGGLGIREGAFSLLMQQFGIAANIAASTALLSLLPIVLASLAGGGLLFWPYILRVHLFLKNMFLKYCNK